MEPVNVLWRLPPQGFCKINVHSYFSNERLPNENVSGIGVVIRNSRGTIFRMMAGSLGIEEQRSNELYAMLEGLKSAYIEDRFQIELETDHEEAYWEWRNANELGVTPEHRYVVQQLQQRKADQNFRMKIRLIDEAANNLAAYLAQYGAERWTRMVILVGPPVVLTAKDPLDAFCLLRTGAIKFDLIVSDVHMPGLDGFELQRKIQREFQIPVVLMSGDREAINICEGNQSGASFFVVKPITTQTTQDLKSIWDFGNQCKKKVAKGKNIISGDSYDNDNEDDIGNKLYEKKSKRKLHITVNERWTRMVILAGPPVGRVLELWYNDMDIGPIEERFMAVHELDIMANVVNEN